MFCEEPWFYVYRSWTGYSIARFRVGTGIEEAALNLDPTQISVGSDGPLMPALDAVALFLNIAILDSDDVIAQWHEHGRWIVDGLPAAGLDPQQLKVKKA